MSTRHGLLPVPGSSCNNAGDPGWVASRMSGVWAPLGQAPTRGDTPQIMHPARILELTAIAISILP